MVIAIVLSMKKKKKLKLEDDQFYDMWRFAAMLKVT